jgi:hypothetical protein
VDLEENFKRIEATVPRSCTALRPLLYQPRNTMLSGIGIHPSEEPKPRHPDFPIPNNKIFLPFFGILFKHYAFLQHSYPTPSHQPKKKQNTLTHRHTHTHAHTDTHTHTHTHTHTQTKTHKEQTKKNQSKGTKNSKDYLKHSNVV